MFKSTQVRLVNTDISFNILWIMFVSSCMSIFFSFKGLPGIAGAPGRRGEQVCK